jgi:outer membrane protein assembly factor BamB
MGSIRTIFGLVLIVLSLTALFTVEATNAQTSSPTQSPTSASTLLWQFNPGNTTNPANKYIAVDWSSTTVLDGVVYVGTSGTHSYNITKIVQTDTIPQYGNFTETVYEIWGGVYALNATTGKQIWSYIGDDCKASPTVAEGIVYAQTGSKKLSALNISNGQSLWTFTADIGVGTSPTLANGKIYVGLLHGNVYALYANSGLGRWNFTADPSHLFSQLYDLGNDVSTPIVDNHTVYVGSLNGNLYALNAESGRKLWSYDAKSPIFRSPAILNGKVYFESGDGNMYALNASTGEKIWNSTIGTILLSFAITNNFAFVDSGSALFTNGNLSVLNDVYALNATNGDKLWNYSVMGDFTGSLTVIDDIVYFGSPDHNLYSFNASTGAKISVYPTEGTIFSAPTVVNDTILYFSSKNGAIYASALPYVPPSPSIHPTPTLIQSTEPLIIGVIVLSVSIFVFSQFFCRRQRKNQTSQENLT